MLQLLQTGTVHVHLIRAIEVKEPGVLNAVERARAARFRFPEHAERWSAYRAGLRVVLAGYLGCGAAEVPITIDEQGKPQVPGLHFNLAHDDDLALVAVSIDGPVGIDLERLARAPELHGCEATFCHPVEIAGHPDDLELLRIWTTKEAFLKMRGTGFLAPPQGVCVSSGRVTDEEGTEWRVHRLEHPSLDGHLAQLCALQEVRSIAILDGPVWTESTAATGR